MSGTTGSPPADSSGSADPQASPTPSDGTVGYTTPEQQQQIDQDNRDADDRGLNQNLAHKFQQRAAQEQAAQAAVAGGGFEFTPEEIGTFHTRWQALADKLGDARRLGEEFLTLTAPAEDDGSGLVGNAAQAHGQAYQDIVKAQQMGRRTSPTT